MKTPRWMEAGLRRLASCRVIDAPMVQGVWFCLNFAGVGELSPCAPWAKFSWPCYPAVPFFSTVPPSQSRLRCAFKRFLFPAVAGSPHRALLLPRWSLVFGQLNGRGRLASWRGWWESYPKRVAGVKSTGEPGRVSLLRVLRVRHQVVQIIPNGLQ